MRGASISPCLPASAVTAALDFNVHSDNDMRLDIAVEIRFSGYQPVSGAQIPRGSPAGVNMDRVASAMSAIENCAVGRRSAPHLKPSRRLLTHHRLPS